MTLATTTSMGSNGNSGIPMSVTKSTWPSKLADLPDGLYFLPVHLAKQIITNRLEEEEVGYQRNLRPSKVKQVTAHLKNGAVKNGRSIYATIIVYRIGNSFECIDGQHRLAGHIEAEVPVPTTLHTMTMDEAREHFIMHNKEATVLPNIHLIRVSNHPLACDVRTIAESCNVSDRQAYVLITGVLGVTSIKLDSGRGTLSEVQMRRAKTVLDIWTKDFRFINSFSNELKGQARSEYYADERGAFSSPTALWILGKLAGNATTSMRALAEEVKIFRDANWTSQSRRSLRTLCRMQGFTARREACQMVQNLILDTRRGQDE